MSSRKRSSSPILILDNGASTIKAGFAGAHEHGSPRLFPNSLARIKGEKRTFVADELGSARDLSSISYRSPFDRGYLMGWETEKPIWDRVFSRLAVEPEATSLFLTEPYNNPPALRAATDQMVFEHWGFRSLYSTTPAQIVSQSPGVILKDEVEPGRSYGTNPECVVVIDSGYSFTHVIPCLHGAPVQDAIRRIDVGGKLLTNHLKTLLSFRQYGLMDETHVVNEIKEACCVASRNFSNDLNLCQRDPTRNPLRQEYVLPDFTSADRMKGFIKSGPNARKNVALDPAAAAIEAEREANEQLLVLNSERFAVPEILFNPSDIGLQQAGLGEAVADSIAALPSKIQGLFWRNVCLMGGNARIPELAHRLKSELQQLSPNELSPKVTINKDPSKTTYVAIQRLFSQPETSRWARENFARCAVTKQEYDEHGSAGLMRKRREVQDWGMRWAGWDG